MHLDGTKQRSAEATEIMRQAMYESGAADKATEELGWKHNPMRIDQAIEQRKEEDQESGRMALLGATAGEAVSHAMHLGKVTTAFVGAVLGQLHAAVEGGHIKDHVVALGETALEFGANAVGEGGGVAVQGAKLAVQGFVRAFQGQDQLRNAADIVGMDLAATDLLDLDQGFKNSVHEKYDGQMTPPSVIRHFKNADGSLTEFGKKYLPTIQAACDEGTKKALECVYADTDNKDWSVHITNYLKAHPEVSQRLESDIGFAKGWDQVMFLKDRDGAADKLDALEKAVHARDARSAERVFVRQA
jgi:hypothetical protein